MRRSAVRSRLAPPAFAASRLRLASQSSLRTASQFPRAQGRAPDEGCREGRDSAYRLARRSTMTSKHPDSVLRHRPFVLFWFARVATTIGYQMLVVAIGWQLYELTGNPLDLGLVGLVQFIPAIAAGAGRSARWPTAMTAASILSACQAIEAVAAAILLDGGCLRRDLARADPRRRVRHRHRARLRARP